MHTRNQLLFVGLMLLLSFQKGFTQAADSTVIREIERLNWQIDSIRKTWNLEGAFQLATKAKKMGEEKLPKDHPTYAQTLNILGTLYIMAGMPKVALPLVIQSQKIREATLGKNTVAYASGLNSLALIYDNTGDSEKAEATYLEAKAIRESIGQANGFEHAGLLINLGIMLETHGRVKEAENYLLQALDILKRNHLETHAFYINGLSALGTLYNKAAIYTKAEEYLKQAVVAVEQGMGKNNRRYTSVLQDLGIMYWSAKKFDLAEPLFLELLELMKKNGDDTNPRYAPGYAQALNNLANVYADLNQFDAAEKMYLEAKGVYKKLNMDGGLEYAQLLANFAFIYTETKSYDAAKEYGLAAKKLWEKIGQAESPAYHQNIFNLAYLCSVSGQADQAFQYYQTGDQIREQLFWGSSSFMSDDEITEFNSVYKNLIDEEKSFGLKNHLKIPEIATWQYNSLIFNKELLLLRSERVKQILQQTTEDGVSQLFADWTGLKSQLERMSADPNQKKAELEKLQKQASELEKQLIKKSEDFAAFRQKITTSDIRQALNPGEAAIEFTHFRYFDPVITDSVVYVALLLRAGDSIPHYFYLAEEKQIKSLMQAQDPGTAVKKLYASRNITPSKSAGVKGLYPLIWQPIDSLLRGISTVYYAPSGLLHGLAFNAIPTDKPGEVLSDRYRLYQMGNTRSIVSSPASRLNSRPGSVFLAGGIRYDYHKPAHTTTPADSLEALPLTTTAITTARLDDPNHFEKGFEFLPGSKQEVMQLEKQLAAKGIPTKVLLDTLATEEQIKALGVTSPVPAVLHLATHGFFFPDPEQTKTGPDAESHFAQLKDPLLRSGLALAGANQTWNTGHPAPGREDGILTAYEIANMNLSGTQLAVLSACETGLGDIQGSEGVYGLQRAFKIAGVKRLIVTLWDVPDKQTAAFMSLFYEKWLGGLDIRTAFYDTQTAMRQRYKDPFVWAAFVLVE